MERRPIRQLPPGLVNRIAAGEVIERPASVVKELVENSIDSGATDITVEIEDGGRELIRVIDNGCGIAPDDLALAFAPHATSKIADDEDLARITTMGFRGEALASIGAVSQARILSRVSDSDTAWEIHNRGGVLSGMQAAAGNVGTTVEVRNLFYNTPARRKFLRAAPTETGHVAEALLRLALPHAHIAFRLLAGGRVSLDLPATTLASRLRAAFSDSIADRALPVEGRNAEIALQGIIGLPESAGPTARNQYFYVNGRHVRDRFIQHALREAYRGLLDASRQPAAVLLLTMPPGDVDVNVHPAKAEVRFRDSGRIHGLVLSAVREKLLGSDLSPAARPAPVVMPERPDVRARLEEFFRQQYPQAALPSAAGEPVRPPGPVAPDRLTAAGHPPDRPAAGAAPSLPVPPTASRPATAPAIQLHNSYLVAETEDGLVIIDQHALHERIIYEQLKARLLRGRLESQRLLIPETLDVSEGQMALLEQLQPLLGRLGIEVGAFGPGTVAIQAFPSFLERIRPAEFVRDLLEKGQQESGDLGEEELLHEFLDMMACRAAVKAGDPLSPAEIETLLQGRHLVERASNCPHGRPTTLRLSLRDLEKQFKRA